MTVSRGERSPVTIDAVSGALVEIVRRGVAEVDPDATVALVGAGPLGPTAKGARVEVLLHRVVPDATVRNRPGGSAAALPLRLGYVVLVRAAEAAAEQRMITAVLGAVVHHPVLTGGGLGAEPWRVGLEDVPDETRLALFTALRAGVGPAVWCEARGMLEF